MVFGEECFVGLALFQVDPLGAHIMHRTVRYEQMTIGLFLV